MTAQKVEELVRQLAESPRPWKKWTLEELVGLGEPAVEHLLPALKHEAWQVREGVVEALGQIGDVRAVVPLSHTLQDDHSLVRWEAAKVLETMAKEGGMGPLIQALRESDEAKSPEPLIEVLASDDGTLRKAAAQALGEMGDARAIEPLAKLLGDKDEALRKTCVQALSRIPERKAVEPLTRALEDESPAIRASAAEALGRKGDANAVAALRKLAGLWIFGGDENDDVKRAARAAIAAIKNAAQ